MAELHLHRTFDGLVAPCLDEEASQAAAKLVTLAQLGGVLVSLTLVLAVPAWLFVLVNLVSSPRVVYRRLVATSRALELTALYARAELPIEALAAGTGTGMGLLGFGAQPPTLKLGWDAVTNVRWTAEQLVFELRDAEPVAYPLDANRQEIARLGQELRGIWERAIEAMPTGDRERDELERQRLLSVQRGRSN